MRKFINSVVLMEAAPEVEMFSALTNYLERIRIRNAPSPDSEQWLAQIARAKTLAKESPRRDVRIWITKTLRYYLAATISSNRMASASEELQIIVDKIINDYKSKVNDPERTTFSAAAQFIDTSLLKHYLTIDYAPIQNYRFENQSMNEVERELYNFDIQYQKQASSLLSMAEGDEIVMTFPDGMVWMLLSRGYCSAEAKAMGHCGNAGAKHGDRILSLRKPIVFRGQTRYEPCLTFILNHDGKLGEMKGRGNDKPSARYHGYIEALLRSDIIKGIRGGGYKPENNFDISDLPMDQQVALLDDKPDLEAGTVRETSGDEIKLWVGDFAWTMLDDQKYDHVDDEASAMDVTVARGGYRSDVRYMSLRHRRETKNGVSIWRPMVFVTLENGIIQQMCGRGDSKPSQKFSKQISAMLELPFIAGISRNDGQNPFTLDCLSKPDRDALLEKRPELGNIKHAFEMVGMTPRLKDRIIGEIEDKGGGISYSPEPKWEENNLILATWKNADDFAEQFADKDSKTFFELDKYGDRADREVNTHVDDDDVKRFFDLLPGVVRKHMIDLATQNWRHDNAIEDDDDEEFENSDEELIEQYLPEDWSAMESACHTGQEVGGQNEISQAMSNAVLGFHPEFGQFEISTYEYQDGKRTRQGVRWSDPVRLVLNPKQIISALLPHEEDDYLPDDFAIGDKTISVDDGRYGFNGFDDEAALERFWEEASFSQSDLPQRPEIDLSKISRESKIDKIKEALNLPMNSYRRFDPDKMTDEELDRKLMSLMDQYYGAEPNSTAR